MAQRIVIPPINPAPPPAPPEWLEPEAHRDWNEIWLNGIASRWNRSEWEVVARLARLRYRFAVKEAMNDDTLARIRVGIDKLEQTLLMTPEAQLKAGIVVEETKVVTANAAASKASIEARMRDAN